MSKYIQSRESAHIHSIVVDKSLMQTSGGGGLDNGIKSNIAPPKPPEPPAPEPVHKVFRSLIIPMTTAPMEVDVGNTWDYQNYTIKNAFVEVEFEDWGSLSLLEREDIQDHIASSYVVIKNTEISDVYSLSIYLLEYTDDSNSYILYDYTTNIKDGFDTKTNYGLPRDGEVVPIPITVRFYSNYGVAQTFRPILSKSDVIDPETGDYIYDLSAGFNPRQPLPEKAFKDYFTKSLCNVYPLLQLHSSPDLRDVFPNNAVLPDSIITGSVQDISDLIVDVYYPVSNNGYPFYKKSESWSITNKILSVQEVQRGDYSGVILVIDAQKAGLSVYTNYLNILSDIDTVNMELSPFGGYIGAGNPFALNGNSYTSILPIPSTPFVGTSSMMPFVGGVQTQVWSIKNLDYPYIAYVKSDSSEYPHIDGTLYTSASPQGFDTQSDIKVSAWVSIIPWGSKIIKSQSFTMTVDSLPYSQSPLTTNITTTTIKEAYIELTFLQWEGDPSKNNLEEVFKNCYLSVIRVSDTGYALLLQPNQSLSRESIQDNQACVFSVYIDSNTDTPLPSNINNYYPIKTRHTSFTTFTTRMCTNKGSASLPVTQNIIVKFIIDGKENTNTDYHPVVPPYIEGETISFSNELNISFLQ